jgi:copper(I)-binding protein
MLLEIAVTRLPLALMLVLPLLGCGQPAPLEVSDPWTRDSVGGTGNAAVFMTIASRSGDRLLAASTPAAAKTDLMTMRGGSDGMEMAYLKSIAVPAGQTVRLDPTGLHVWLEGLKQPLAAGQTFPLSLTFEKAGRRDVTVTVIAPSAAPPA